jgi:hypothetical protein
VKLSEFALANLRRIAISEQRAELEGSLASAIRLHVGQSIAEDRSTRIEGRPDWGGKVIFLRPLNEWAVIWSDEGEFRIVWFVKKLSDYPDAA